jgi:hypothetical protein
MVVQAEGTLDSHKGCHADYHRSNKLEMLVAISDNSPDYVTSH